MIEIYEDKDGYPYDEIQVKKDLVFFEFETTKAFIKRLEQNELKDEYAQKLSQRIDERKKICI